MELNIGQRVRVKDWENIPHAMKKSDSEDLAWHKGRAKLCGLSGVIVDKIYSERNDKTLYRFKADIRQDISEVLFEADCFEAETNDDSEYTYEFVDYYDRVEAVLYHNVDGVREELARGKGYIYNSGAAGYAQAASYALKKIYEALGGNF